MLPFYVATSGNAIGWGKLFRGDHTGTQISNVHHGSDNNITQYANASHSTLDSPNTTSAQTYTLRMGRGSGSTNYVSTSGWAYSLTAMEIAA